MKTNPLVNYVAQSKVKFGGDVNMGTNSIIDYNAIIDINGQTATALRVERETMDVSGKTLIITTTDKIYEEDDIKYKDNDYTVTCVLEDSDLVGVEYVTKYVAYCSMK